MTQSRWDASGLLQQILPRLRVVSGPDQKGECVCWCPFHPDGQGKPPHAPDLRVSERGYYCFRCKAKGSLRDLARHLGIEAGGQGRRLVATWDYYTPDGSKKLFEKCRFETPQGKTYGLRRAAPEDWPNCPHRGDCQADRRDCREGWIWNLKPKPCSPAPPPALYNQALLQRVGDEWVHHPEGEQSCDVLVELGYIAVCNPHGAGEWRREYSEALRSLQVVIWVDADDPGRKHGQLVAQSLFGQAKSIRIIDLYPDRNDGSDVVDWTAEREAQGRDRDSIREELDALIAQAPGWRPRTQDTLGTSLPTMGSAVGSEVTGQERVQGVTLAALRRKAKEGGVQAETLPVLGEVQPPIFQRGLSHILASPPKAGKTTLLYHLAKEWAGAGRSILFMSEEAELVWCRRLEADDAEEEVLERITLVAALGEGAMSLLDRMCHGSEEIVILDTAKILGVEDENDAATVNRTITPWVVEARESGKTLIVAHHMRKGGGRAVEALAGSYSWAAVFDTVIEIELDEQDSRRRLRAVGRLLPSCKLLYELRGNDLVLLGSPEQVELGAAKERAFEALTGEWQTTAQLHNALGDPKPSQEQLRKALNSLAAEGSIERDPPWSEGPKQGAAYRWRTGPPPATSLPTATSLVGSEVGGSPQGSLAMPPATGGQ
jgi:hypothetical protein